MQLRDQEYHTLNQLQADVELICSNAITFNLKPSKVYKNAQALSKASKKQFALERGLLVEAIAALHPGGPEAAMKDEAEEEKQIKACPPPKKPAKPSKPPKKPPTASGLTGINPLQLDFVQEGFLYKRIALPKKPIMMPLTKLICIKINCCARYCTHLCLAELSK